MLADSIFDAAAEGWHDETIGHILNGDFEVYRRISGWGGDFFIYSDVHWESDNFCMEFN